MLSTTGSIISWTFGYLIAVITLCLKIYTRIKYLNGMEADDYVAVITLCLLTGAMGVLYTMLVLGLQEPEVTWLMLPREDLIVLFKCFFISVQMYTMGIFFSKLTLILLYKRIAKKSQAIPWLNPALNGLIVVCVVFTVVGITLNFFWCQPLHAFWEPMPLPQMPRYCSQAMMKLSVYMYSGYNILTDIFIMIVPFFFLSGAAIRSRSQRLALFGLFSMGFFVIASTVVKIIIIHQNFHTASLVLWSFVEGCIAIVVVCLPSLPPLIWKNTRLGEGTMLEPSIARLESERNSATISRELGSPDHQIRRPSVAKLNLAGKLFENGEYEMASPRSEYTGRKNSTTSSFSAIKPVQSSDYV